MRLVAFIVALGAFSGARGWQYYAFRDAGALCSPQQYQASAAGGRDDTPAAPLQLPFPFRFFDTVTNTIYVSPNGGLKLEREPFCGCCLAGSFYSGEKWQQCTLESTYFNLIAGFWTDLNPRHGGVASWILTGIDENDQCASVWYRNLAHWGDTRSPLPTSAFAIAINAAGVIQLRANATRLSFPAPGQGNYGWGVSAITGLRPRKSWPQDKIPEEYGGASIGVDAPGYYVPTATLRAVEDGAEDLRSNWCPMPTQVCAAVESGAARLHAESFGCASHLEFDCVWSWDNATAANASGQTHRVSSHLAFTSGPVECPFPEGMGAEAAPYLRLHLASRANATVVPGSSIHTSIPLLHNNVTFTFSGTAWEPLTCPCSSACSGECAPAPESLPHPTECPAPCPRQSYQGQCNATNEACERLYKGASWNESLYRDPDGTCCALEDYACDGTCGPSKLAQRFAFMVAEAPFCCDLGDVDLNDYCCSPFWGEAIDDCGVCYGGGTGRLKPNLDMDCLGNCFTNTSKELCDTLLVPTSATVPVRIDATAAEEAAEARTQQLRIYFNVSTASALSLVDADVTGGGGGDLPNVGLQKVRARAPGEAEWGDVWPSPPSPVPVAAGSAIEATVDVSVAPLFAKQFGLSPIVKSGAITVLFRVPNNEMDLPVRSTQVSLPVSFINCGGLSHPTCLAAPGCFLCSFRGHEKPTPVTELDADQSAALLARALLQHLPLPAWLRRLVDGRPEPATPSGGASAEDAPDHSRRRLSYIDVYEEQFITTSVCLDGSGNSDCLAYLALSAGSAFAPGLVLKAAAIVVALAAWAL